jgi:NAD(P)H-hydrate epimerase
MLRQAPGATADVIFVYGERALRPLASRAWRELVESARGRIGFAGTRASFEAGHPSLQRPYDICLDGIFGLQYRAPLDRRAAEVLGLANRLPVRLRAAVDLPSGLDDAGGFRADFTYATGILKEPLLGCANAGRLRYLDLGFFGLGSQACGLLSRVLTPDALAPLARLRLSQSDKRSFGHLCIFAGSRNYPGAALMAVRAALRSGAGRVTAARSPLVLTPHAGEYARIGGGPDLPGFCRERRAVVVLKGPVTRICRGVPPTIFHSTFGGPVLARGGSGDLLAGLLGGLLAQAPEDLLAAACRGVVWHGLAADALARDRGQTSVVITQLLDYLPDVLRRPPML